MARKEITRDSRIIEIEAIIIAYAMSRLDVTFLAYFRYESWRAAFKSTGELLHVPPASMKNLRDEFDPLHMFRKGWHQRPLRANRQRVLAEFCELSDDALLEVAGRLLARDRETNEEIVQPIAFAKERIDNVAERLRTGRIAEEFFLANSKSLCGVQPNALIDRRQEAAGFDFAVNDRPELAIEVKGIKERSGAILFTDCEWRTARTKKEYYWLVVIGNLAHNPVGRLWRNPTELFIPKSNVRRVSTLSWRVRLSVD